MTFDTFDDENRLETVERVVSDIKEAGGEAMAVASDISQQKAAGQLIKQAIDAFGKLDVLVNNAGIMDGMEGVADISDERWDDVLTVNTMLGMGLNPRAGQPNEIANLALFLESDEASFINGAIVVADGGWSAY